MASANTTKPAEQIKSMAKMIGHTHVVERCNFHELSPRQVAALEREAAGQGEDRTSSEDDPDESRGVVDDLIEDPPGGASGTPPPAPGAPPPPAAA